MAERRTAPVPEARDRSDSGTRMAAQTSDPAPGLPGRILEAVERHGIPDPLARWGIRRLLDGRLRRERRDRLHSKGRDSRGEILRAMRSGPVAPVPDRPNAQHYELPAAFFRRVLGPRLKYSSALWPEGVDDLAAAEERMLEVTARRARLVDGQDVLELGCGWGSLTLWAAERYPGSRIVGVSNSTRQRRFIEAEAREWGLRNVKIVTADMNDFTTDRRFNRVVSVEMFEHMRDWGELLRRIRGWLRPEGRLFVHVFSHRELAYLYEDRGPADWMARHFFTGGLMPSHDLLPAFDDHLVVEDRWRVDGGHYARTAEAWLRNLDGAREELDPVFRQVYGSDAARRWRTRWRFFFLAVAEMFAWGEGREWGVSHYRLVPRAGERGGRPAGQGETRPEVTP